MLVPQSCPTVCNPMYCSPSCSSIHGILKARILEWEDFPGGPVAKTMQGPWVRSLVRELDPTCFNEDLMQSKKERKKEYWSG